MLAVAAGSLAALLAVRKRVAVSSLAAGVYPSLACSRETFLPTYKYYLHTHVQATDSRLYVYIYIYRVGERRLPDPGCKSSRPNKNSASRSPLLVVSSATFSSSFGRKSPSYGEPTETGKRGFCSSSLRSGSRLSCFLLPCRARSTFRRLTEQKTIDRTREHRRRFPLPSKISFCQRSHPSRSARFSVSYSRLASRFRIPSPSVVLRLSAFYTFFPNARTYVFVCTYAHMHVRALPSFTYGERTGSTYGVSKERKHDPRAASTNGYVRVRGSNAYKLLKIGPLFKAGRPLRHRPDTDRIPTSYRRLRDVSRVDLFQRSLRLYRSLTGVLSFLLRLRPPIRECDDLQTAPLPSFHRRTSDLCSRFLPFCQNHFDDRRPIEM